MGIGSAGVGVGAFSFSLIMKYIVQQYSWRGSLLILGGIQLHVVICGLFLVEPSSVESLRKKQKLKDEKAPYETKHQNEGRNTDLMLKSAAQDEFYQIRFTESNTLIPTGKDIKELESSKKSSLKKTEPLKTFGAKMRSVQMGAGTRALLTNPVFWIIFLSDFLSWLIQFVPYVHLPEKTKMLGIEEGALMVSIMGFGNALGKLFFGFVCTIFNWKPLYVFIVAQTLFGVCTILSPLCVELWSLTLFSVSFGVCSGAYALMMVVPSDLLGMDNFSLAYGFMLAGEGLGVYLGPPLVGWMSDLYDSYDSSFYLAGCLLLISAFILLLPACLPRFQRNNDETNNNNDNNEEKDEKNPC